MFICFFLPSKKAKYLCINFLLLSEQITIHLMPQNHKMYYLAIAGVRMDLTGLK